MIADKIHKLVKQSGKNIVFYFDEDGSFKENLPEIENAGIQVLEVKGNYFYIKYFLETSWDKSPLFLYHSYKKPDNKKIRHYPLIDSLLANVEYSTDDASEFITSFNLNAQFTDLVRKYINILKTKTNQKKLARILDPAEFNQDKLELGVISVLLDFNTVVSKNNCLARLLHTATDNAALDKVLKQLALLELDDYILLWFNNLLNQKEPVLNKNTLVKFAEIIKYNILTAHLSETSQMDPYLRFKINNTAVLNKIDTFFDDWEQSNILNQHIDTVFSGLAKNVLDDVITTIYGLNAEYGYYSKEMLSQLLISLYKEVFNNPLKTKDNTIKWVRKLNVDQNFEWQLWFLYYTAGMIDTLNSYQNYKFNTANLFIKEYTSELYKIDYAYRKAVIAYNKVSDNLYEFEQYATKTFNTLNDKYDRYLIELNVEWQSMLHEIDFDYKQIDVNKQFNFYADNIEGRDYKLAVIISDAFRFELGYELYTELLAESKNTVELIPSLASIPSYTNLGMSNLLPNKGIEVEKGDNDLVFKINGVHTVSTNRENILKQIESQSSTIDYAHLIKFDRDKGRDFFKKNRVVYIYHDWIDAIGDKKRTEHQTFDATTKAVDDIKNLIGKIYGWNVTHVLVTSDHGFLFNYNTLQENSRENLPQSSGYTREHVRFVISDELPKKVDGYKFDLSNTTNINTDLKVAVPRAINRFRKQGNIGVQFVHGGASLQELITPVITFYKQKNKEPQSVSFKRIDNNSKITSNNLKVIILQDEPVSNDFSAANFTLAIYGQNGELLSNEVKVTLNATSANPKERIYEFIVSLNETGSKASFGYLRAFTEKDKINPLAINDIVTIKSFYEKDEF